MSTNSNSLSSLSICSSSDEDFIDDTMDDQIEAKIEAQIERQLAGSSNDEQRHYRMYLHRDRQGAHNRLHADYFNDNPVYTATQFHRRHQIRKHLFEHIMQTLGEWSPYFCQRYDAFGKIGLSPMQKCTSAMHMLAYGVPADQIDEYMRIAETTSLECLAKFAKGIRKNFGDKYLKRPTTEDIQHLLQLGQARGFPGMLGSVDCMHWQWKKCPIAWKGQFTHGYYGVPTIMLEAVASHDLWIWHAFFDVASSNNDINVLDQSPLFTEVLQGRAPPIQFIVNGNDHDMGYYLADGIYPEWATFVKTIPLPQSDKARLFA